MLEYLENLRKYSIYVKVIWPLLDLLFFWEVGLCGEFEELWKIEDDRKGWKRQNISKQSTLEKG